MKRFMFLSISVLCLAIAVLIGFYVGSQSATAQTPAGTVFYVNTNAGYHYYYAILPNGDIYVNVGNYGNPPVAQGASYCGNFWSGQVATDKSTWGTVKGQYNK
jgi:hypothetical protein